MTKILPNKLLVAEHFYSVQGEGKTSGTPAYFIRLANCNLSCGCSSNFLNKIKKGEIQPDLNSPFVGDLERDGSSTWSCDTTPVWLRGNYVEFQEIIDSWKEQGIYEDICNGTIHIIWTGGEPTIKGHQESIRNFYDYWKSTDPGKFWPNNPGFGIRPWFELETNGTIYLEPAFKAIIDQINCSPKLSNSGMAERQRINRPAIHRIMEHQNYQFKFVISNEEDIEEMFRDFIVPFEIPLKNVVCMPALTDQDNFFERTQWCMEMAKKYKFIGLTRLHVAAWNSLTGV